MQSRANFMAALVLARHSHVSSTLGGARIAAPFEAAALASDARISEQTVADLVATRG